MPRLFLEGYEATLTLGNTKGIDILIYNPKNNKQFKVEVKTSTTISNECLFGGKVISWFMNKKHQIITDPTLIYCFVYINKTTKGYRIFFVPSKDIAEYCKWSHQHWLKSEHKKKVKDSDMRRFLVKSEDESLFENNFSIFE